MRLIEQTQRDWIKATPKSWTKILSESIFKGQLISKRLIFQNRNENIAMISALVHKNFQGRDPSINFVAILENQHLYKFVLRLSDLYDGQKLKQKLGYFFVNMCNRMGIFSIKL